MQKLMGDEGWVGGGLFFSTDPKCLCSKEGLAVYRERKKKERTSLVVTVQGLSIQI